MSRSRSSREGLGYVQMIVIIGRSLAEEVKSVGINLNIAWNKLCISHLALEALAQAYLKKLL